MPSSCHGESNLLGGKRFSQPGTCDVDVVLLARYASRAIDMKQATRKLTAREMPRMPMVKTTASDEGTSTTTHLLKMHSDFSRASLKHPETQVLQQFEPTEKPQHDWGLNTFHWVSNGWGIEIRCLPMISSTVTLVDPHGLYGGSRRLILKRSFEANIDTPQDQMQHRNIEHWPLALSKDKAIEKVPNKTPWNFFVQPSNASSAQTLCSNWCRFFATSVRFDNLLVTSSEKPGWTNLDRVLFR